MYPNKKLHRYLLNKQYIVIPIGSNSNNHHTITATINGQTCCLVVDTGASHTCLDIMAVTDTLQLIVSNMEHSQVIGLGNVEGKLSLTFIESITLGEQLHLTQRSLPVIDLGVVRQVFWETNQIIIHGILGADFLSERNALISYENSCLYLLQPNIAD